MFLSQPPFSSLKLHLKLRNRLQSGHYSYPVQDIVNVEGIKMEDILAGLREMDGVHPGGLAHCLIIQGSTIWTQFEEKVFTDCIRDDLWDGDHSEHEGDNDSALLGGEDSEQFDN